MELYIDGAQNVRDLGGIKCGDKTLKMGRVIRSSHIGYLTDKGEKQLTEKGLRMVVDFRSEPEILSSPDRVIDGVRYEKCPILKSLTVGLSRDGKKQTVEEQVINIITTLGTGVRDWLARLYEPLVTDEFSINGYRRFFDLLKENKEGALLYHCAAGKDRVGTGTVLFLMALGASQEDIIKDYMLTNKSTAESTKRTIERAKEMGLDSDHIDCIPFVNGVIPEYIQVVFEVIEDRGGIEEYLKKCMGIDEKYLKELRESYLE
ncbi:MAG: tyrosine-protein phosphatase [Clostridia bacterium]|nr:tyrosine-protein phosphatase [Clostridia bacterium]